MSTRLAALALLGSLVLISGCGATNLGPSTEPGVPGTPPGPTATRPATSSKPSLAASPSGGQSVKPVASGAIDPASFSSTVDNRWFPLTAGTKLTYQGTKDGKRAVETFTVTATTKPVAGVTCVVTEDVLSLGGVATEKVIGYFAQAPDGSVWSFGEDNQELDANGHVVSTDGSWHAGVDKALPALVVEGTPVVGHSFEHAATKNDFAVLSLATAVKVPYGSFDNALVTKEWSPLEPDIETHKFYVPHLGVVRDVAVKGPTEELVLAKVEHP
jgi:hypothetical protein